MQKHTPVWHLLPIPWALVYKDDDHRFPKCYLESWFSLDLGMGEEKLSEKGWEEEETG